MNRRTVPRAGMSTLQAVLLLGAAFVVVWGLMAAWQAAQKPTTEQALKTLNGEPGDVAARPPGGGGGDGGEGTNPPTDDKNDWSLADIWMPEWGDIPDAIKDGFPDDLSQIKLPPGLADKLKGLTPERIRALKIAYVAGKYLMASYEGIQEGNDRKILVALFEGLADIAVDNTLDALGLKGTLAQITGGWTGSQLAGTFANLFADGVESGGLALRDAFDYFFPGERQKMIEWRRRHR